MADVEHGGGIAVKDVGPTTERPAWGLEGAKRCSEEAAALAASEFATLGLLEARLVALGFELTS